MDLLKITELMDHRHREKELPDHRQLNLAARSQIQFKVQKNHRHREMELLDHRHREMELLDHRHKEMELLRITELLYHRHRNGATGSQTQMNLAVWSQIQLKEQ